MNQDGKEHELIDEQLAFFLTCHTGCSSLCFIKKAVPSFERIMADNQDGNHVGLKQLLQSVDSQQLRTT
jgi:hypothetical protein